MQADGVACEPPGAFGENLLVEGLDRASLRPGDRLQVGDEVLLELHDVREPCGTLRKLDRRFPDLLVGRSGWVCRVLAEGVARPGQAVVTSGMGGVFPKEIPVGQVVDSWVSRDGLYTEARVKLHANLNQLETVRVLVKY